MKTPDCGHFSTDGLEYIVTRPDTPRPFDNMLWNRQLLGNVQQTGAGYTDYQIGEFEMTKLSQGIGRICDFDVYGRDTFLNRLVYVRDNTTGKFWNVGWEPVKAKPSRFRARHGLGYTIIENTTDGIDSSFRVFVPAGDEPAEYWTLRLRPLPDPGVESRKLKVESRKKTSDLRPSTFDGSLAATRDLTVFVYEQISFKYMWGFNSYGDMFYRNSRLDAKRNMAIFTKHPFVTPHHWQTGYLAADRRIDGFDGSKDFFVGTYNQLNEPQAVVNGRCTGSVGSSDATIAALQFNLGKVKAGETVEINLVLGVSDTEAHAAAAAKKGLASVGKKFEALVAAKKALATRNAAQTPDAQFNATFNAWHKQQALFGAEWCRWGWMGYRDIVQHAMGCSSFYPERTREILLTAFRHQYSSGLALRGWNPIDTKEYSDSALWLVFTLCAYLRETGDKEFLDIKVPFYDKGEATVLGHIRRALDFLERNKGAHRLLLIKFGDWNDSLTGIGKGGKGESVWLSMAYSEALRQMAELYGWLGDEASAVDAVSRAAAMNKALNEEAWDGNWYVRGFDDDGNPIGSSRNKEGTIFLNTQSWAIICGAATPDRVKKMLASIDRKLKTPLGYQMMAPAFKHFDPVIGRVTSMEPGICENGTIYTHCNSWMVLALIRAGMTDRAWALYRDATPAYGDSPLKKANPRYVYGNCFFGPEHRNAPYRMEFNWITGSIAWFFNIELDEFLGIRRDYAGITIAPHLPKDWKGFEQDRTWRGRTFHVKVVGGGDEVASVSIDGKDLPSPFIPQELVRDGSRITVTMRHAKARR